MSTYRLMKGSSLLALVYLLASVTPAWSQEAALPSALGLVPDGAPVALIVPSLSSLSQKIAKLNEESLDSAIPQMADVLSIMKLMAGAMAGVDDSGSLVATILSIDGLDGDDPDKQPPAVVLVPVSNYGAFVGNYGGNADEPITTLLTPQGSTYFARKIGQHAVMGQNQEDVNSYQPAVAPQVLAQAAGAVGREYLSLSDVAVIVNIEAIEPIIRPKLEKELEKMFAQLDQELANDSEAEAFQGLIKAVASIYGDTAHALLRDTSVVVAGLDLTDSGVGMSYTAQFKPGSPTARIFTNGGAASEQLARLHDQPYWLASAMDLRGISVQLLVDAVQAKLPQADPAGAADPVTEMFTQAMDLFARTKGIATAYTLPAQPGMMGMGGGFMNGVAVYETTDGQAYTESVRRYFESLQGMMEMVNGLNDAGVDQPDQHLNPMAKQGGQFSVDVQYTPNAMMIDGLQVDEYQIQYQIPPEMTEDMGPAGPMAMIMMGGTGQSGYIAAKGNLVVMTTTRDAQVMRQALASTNAKTGLGLDGPIDRVRRGGLPADASAEFYLSIPGLMDGVNMFMMMFGQQPMQVPADLPPIGWGASIQDHGVVSRLYIPIEVVRFCKDVADRAMMMGADAPPNGHDDQPWGPDGQGDDGFDRQGPPPAPH